MSMLKLFLINIVPANWLAKDTISTIRDPLLHPDLDAMSLTELADLPLMPENLGRSRPQPGMVEPSLRPCA